jgi:eukaryotic-like serine/threonine-protein kinase
LTLTPGTRLGVYEVAAQIGEGGMGQVFRATDTKLKRQVAIKILPPSLAADHDRLARFQREAEVLASLSHPHIAGIYGLEESDGVSALVMELVDGEDLSQRIARGAISIDEALPIAKQIAEALEAAHEQGIIHRDLKPANIKVKPDGTVKVLDFGLAKAMDQGPGIRDQGSAHLANSPTITSPAMTRAGLILGTAAYMSPEQARGRVVDRRADLWALGCVLYEMLTAVRAFDGDTTTDVLSAVVSREPDWAKLPRETPVTVQRLLRRSLRKDVRTRLQSAGDARVELDEAFSAPDADSAVALSAARRLPSLPTLAFTAAGVAIAFAALWLTRPPAAVVADPPAMRFTIALPSTMSSPGVPTISPDGRWIAISALGPTGSTSEPGSQILAIWLRPMDGQVFQLIAGTEQGLTPIWSPDSRELAFFARGALNRVAVTGGVPTRVADVAPGLVGSLAASLAAWGSDGTILLTSAGQVYRVPASGGTLTQVTTEEAGPNVIRSAPSWLPGNRFLFSELASGVGTGEGIGGLFMQSLNGGTPTRLLDGRTIARYTADGLLAARFTVTGANIGTIRAHRFDIERGIVEQPGVVLAADVNAIFGVSNTGVLVYRRATAGTDHRLQWVDRNGQPAGDGFDVSGSGPFNLSLDERLVAFQEANDLMVRDIARGVTTRVVQGPGVLEPILSPDGRRIAYSKIVPPQIGIAIRPTAGGPEEVVFRTPDVTLVEDWSRDGRFLLGIQSSGQRSPNRGVIIPLDGDRTPLVFADLPYGSGLDEPRFSRDGKWVVYNAADSGRQQVYLTPVPPTGERWQLSTDGGAQGRWRSDGGAVFYLSSSGQLMEVAVTKQQPPRIGRPQVLFETGLEMASNIDQYLPSADGSRFLLRRPRGSAGAIELQVIVNWPTLLSQASRQ